MSFLYRTLPAILLSALFLPFPHANAAGYVDVSTGYKHYQAIVALSDRGVIKGYSDRTFRPAGTINRAEAVKILVEARFSDVDIARALDDHTARGHAYINLPDVRMGDWFGPYVELAYRNAIVRGYPDNTFKPANTINFAEGLKIAIGAYRIDPTETPFRDSALIYMKPSDWFSPYFSYARENGVINPEKFYHPGQAMTRGEFAEIIYRLDALASGHSERVAASAVSSDEYRITIPRLDIVDQRVDFADPYDAKGSLELLRTAPFGHYLASPDSGKKFVLFGHSSGYAWDDSPYKIVLRQIDRLQTGDRIYINFQEKGYVYQVARQAIIPATQDVRILDNPDSDEMALYTCWPPDRTQERFVVYAHPL